MKRFLILMLMAGMAISSAVSQPWLQQNPAESTPTGTANWYELKNSFQTWFQDRDQGKGTGYKQFERYLAFLEPRVYPTGNFPEGALWQAYQQHNDQALKSGSYSANWTHLGPVDVPRSFGGSPNSGVGRINCIAFHPTNPNLFYVGAPSGGVWKTTDGGSSWSTTTDKLPALGISDIAINPVNPSILYIVTGDKDGGNTCPTYSYGILKSTDAGATWDTTGLKHDTPAQIRMRRILVHPTTPDILITAGGTGIYRSTDAGATWVQTKTGNFYDLEFKPGTPSVIYACTGNQILISTDAGITFNPAGTGLPDSGVGRIEMAVTAANPSVVYAVMTNATSGFKGLYKSSDSGATWVTQSSEATINIFSYEANGSGNTGIGWYAIALAVDQQNENIVYSGSVNLWRSINGGAQWTLVAHWYGADSKPYVHADEHTLVVNPLNNVCYSGNDGGIYKTTDQGTTWTDISAGLSILQVYRMAVSASNPEIIIEGSQDNGTYKLNNGTWNDIYGGDGMECAIDPVSPEILYASTQNGGLIKSTNGGRDWVAIKPDAKGAWITPFQVSPLVRNMIVAGYKSVYLSTSYANSWRKISNELAGGNFLNEITFAPSDPAWIYVSSSASLWGTQDMGANWTRLNAGLPNLYIEGLQVAPSEPQKIWVALSGYTEGQKVYFSDDGGRSWKNYSEGLPNVPVNCLTINKLSKYDLYAGTDLGVYYRNPTMDQWVPFNDGLPNVIVNELDINYKNKKIRAGTFGRGIWESDIIENGNWPPAIQLTGAEEPERINLSWLEPAERRPDHYKLYRDTLLLATTATTAYTDEVDPGSCFTYQVVAVYSDGESTPSNPLTARALIEPVFPYREDFTTQNSGWLVKKDPTEWQWGNGTTLQMNPLGTSGFIGISSALAYQAGKHASGYAILPKMDLSDLVNPVITFRYCLRRWLDLDHLYLVYRTPENPTWTTLTETPYQRTWQWKNFSYTLPPEVLVPEIELAFYYTDNNGIGYGAAIDDFYLGPDVSGTGDQLSLQEVAVYPNPTDGTVYLHLKGLQNREITIDVLDVNGRILQQKEIGDPGPDAREEISLRTLSHGTYLIRITGGNQQWIKPVTRN